MESDLLTVESDLLTVETDLLTVETDLLTVESDLIKVESDLVKVETDLVIVESNPIFADSSTSKNDILKIFSADFFADSGSEYVTLTYFFFVTLKSQKQPSYQHFEFVGPR